MYNKDHRQHTEMQHLHVLLSQLSNILWSNSKLIVHPSTNNICIHYTEEESDEVPDDVFLFYGQPVAVLSTSLLTFTTSDLKSVSDF